MEGDNSVMDGDCQSDDKVTEVPTTQSTVMLRVAHRCSDGQEGSQEVQKPRRLIQPKGLGKAHDMDG